jgi:hypothetical protein
MDIGQDSDSTGCQCNTSILAKCHFVYLTQVVLIYIIVVTSLINISLESERAALWLTVLAGSLGYLLPNPQPRSSNSSETNTNGFQHNHQ